MVCAREIETIRLTQPVSYPDAMLLQQERRRAVEAGRLPGALFLLEHTPVITMGRRARREHLLLDEAALCARGIPVYPADRGGGVTYHGPGQLVAYPVLQLQRWRASIDWYLRSLEEVLIRVLSAYGLRPERSPGYTGVWVNGAKIAAIGVGIHHWVTFHGAALNVNPDMRHFDLIVPCGLEEKSVTSMRQLLGAAPPLSEIMDLFASEFLAYFEACTLTR